MIDPEKRKTVYLLHKSGFGVMKIARDLGIDKKTVKRIIDAKGEMPLSNRKDRIDLDHKQLKELFEECSGMAERMHELLEQRGIDIAYSTLTKRIREQKLRVSEKPRSNIVPDSPGAEYQHDTSPYWVVLGDHKIKIQASLLYYRYSKRRYLQFYPYFRRFQMKVFLHEAFMYFGYTCKAMVIDNTNLAVKSGTG